MRKWYYIGLIALLGCCCTREQEPEIEKADPEGRVEVTFTFTGELMPTKALGEEPEISTINVAVFGGSGYLKEYQTVIPTRLAEDYKYTYEDKNKQTVTKWLPQYSCTISLALTNSSRRVHLIANGPDHIPFGKDYDVLPTLLSGVEKTGFWQIVTLDNVSALQDNDGDYVYPDISRKREDGEPYVPTNELKEKFQNIALIRNWAKIELTADAIADSHFLPYSFAVVNVPSQGTLVPYGGTKGFITNYKDLSFDQLRSDEYDYAGNLPSSVVFDSTIPSAQDFKDYTGGVKQYVKNPAADDEDHTVYLYERPIPDGTIPPTYVIVYGLYKNDEDSALTAKEKEEGVECFYKVDLMTGSEYYPVLRNFKYQIHIEKISAKGHGSPAAAAAAAGSADVSADVNASRLPDISDGTRRMAIQPWMSKTFVHSELVEERLYVTFYNDINGDNPEPNKNPDSVTWELIPKLEEGNIIKEVSIGKAVDYDPLTEEKPGNYGWRPVSFGIASPAEARIRTQTLRIKCKTNPADEKESPLYRDIVISLLPIQPLRVSLGSDRVLKKKGEEVRVDTAIPDGLVESMFPLYFIIEAKDRSLTPDNTKEGNVMPVISGASLAGDSKQTFYFQRTLTWSEYNSLPSKLDYEEETRWRTFSSYFVTNCESSATDVYVGNEFFYTKSARFVNIESFNKPRYTSSIPFGTGGTVKVAAGMMSEQTSYETVYLELKNLVPSDNSWQPESSGEFAGKYAYTPTSKEMSFNLKTTAEGGNVAVTLSTESGAYEPVTLTPWHFTNVGFVDGMIMPGDASKYSQAAWGYVNSVANSDNQVLLGFNTDQGKLHPSVCLKDISGGLSLLSTYSSASTEDGYNLSTQHNSKYAGQENYHWVEFNTPNGSFERASVTLSAVGYVEQTVPAGRFKGNLSSLTMGVNEFKNLVDNGREYDKDGFSLSVWSSDLDGKAPAKHKNGLLLPSGGHYRLDAHISSDYTDVFLYYVQITYYKADELMRPRSAEPEQDECNYFAYSGNYYDYIWTLPYGQTSGSLVMDAFSDKDILISRIILRGFHGVLYDSANEGGGDIGFDDNLNDGGSL